MSPIHARAACEPPSSGEQTVQLHASPSRGSTGTTPIQDPGGPPHRILVVDADRALLQLWADNLIRSGYRVDTAEDGAAAWLALDGNNYHLLLTDNNMPKVPCVELVKKLRSARMDLPVVLASGAIPTEAIRRNPSLQLAASLLKPFTLVELLDTVGRILGAVARHNRPAMSSRMLAAAVPRLSPISP